MKKQIMLIFLILFISYLLTVLAAEVPPQPTPPGPTGPGPGTGEKEHDQPSFGPTPEELLYTRRFIPAKYTYHIGFNLYKTSNFKVGNSVLNYGSRVCQNDKVDVDFDISAEWFDKGGLVDSPPVQFYNLSFNELIQNLEQNKLYPLPKMCIFSLIDENDKFSAFSSPGYSSGSVLCSKSCDDIPKIRTEQIGLINFDINCNIECVFLREKPKDEELMRHDLALTCSDLKSLNDVGVHSLIFSNGIDKISFSTQFNVVSNMQGPKLDLVSYDYKNGRLLARMKNSGDANAIINSINFDKAATEVLKPKGINAGANADFIYQIDGSGKVKMDIYYSAAEKGCLKNTNFKVTYELDLTKAVTPQKPEVTPPVQTPPVITPPIMPPIEIPTAVAEPTPPIIYRGICDQTTDVNNLKISVAGFGVSQYSVDSMKKGESVTVNDAKITGAVNDYLKYCNSDECIVPIKISTDNDFELKVKDIKVAWK